MSVRKEKGGAGNGKVTPGPRERSSISTNGASPCWHRDRLFQTLHADGTLTVDTFDPMTPSEKPGSVAGQNFPDFATRSADVPLCRAAPVRQEAPEPGPSEGASLGREGAIMRTAKTNWSELSAIGRAIVAGLAMV